MRLRVGVETSISLFDAAGSGRYAREIVRALRAEAPEDVEIVEIRAAEAPVAGSRWRRAAFVLWWELVYCRLVLPRRIAAEGLDLLHCTAPTPMPAAGGAVPVITSIHDTFLFSHPEWFTPVRRRRTRRWWRAAARSSAHVLASSQATRETLVRDLGVTPDRSSAVLLGVGPVAPEAAPGGEPFLLSVGTLEPRKNLGTVLEAMARVKAHRGRTPPLHLVGGTGWGDVGLAAAVQRLGLADDVRMLGFVPEARLAELYASAQALIYASLDEGFGFPPLEAMACGCPVIASNAGSIPEVVGDAAVLVDPRDAKEIAAAIEAVLDDPNRRRELSERGRRRARTLTWAECARETLQVYRRVFAERSVR